MPKSNFNITLGCKLILMYFLKGVCLTQEVHKSTNMCARYLLNSFLVSLRFKLIILNAYNMNLHDFDR